jgi:hypothetical protein
VDVHNCSDLTTHPNLFEKFNGLIKFFTKAESEKFIGQRSIKAFYKAIGRRVTHFCGAMINVVKAQKGSKQLEGYFLKKIQVI